uniref:ATPase subunit 8 n=1 Tax=Haedus sp. TaxID=2931292 RepID=A0A8T9ZYG5_9HEMI|nr:ATPase subunit 8 [Haedus sp.]
MPQMSPLWWLPLMLWLTSILVFMMIMIYFIKENKMMPSTNKINMQKKMNWKW